jgi:hypothetical protein
MIEGGGETLLFFNQKVFISLLEEKSIAFEDQTLVQGN